MNRDSPLPRLDGRMLQDYLYRVAKDASDKFRMLLTDIGYEHKNSTNTDDNNGPDVTATGKRVRYVRKGGNDLTSAFALFRRSLTAAWLSSLINQGTFSLDNALKLLKNFKMAVIPAAATSSIAAGAEIAGQQLQSLSYMYVGTLTRHILTSQIKEIQGLEEKRQEIHKSGKHDPAEIEKKISHLCKEYGIRKHPDIGVYMHEEDKIRELIKEHAEHGPDCPYKIYTFRPGDMHSNRLQIHIPLPQSNPWKVGLPERKETPDRITLYRENFGPDTASIATIVGPNPRIIRAGPRAVLN